MKRISGMVIAAGVFAWGAAAQDDPDQAKIRLQKLVAEAKVMGVQGGVMGPAVKGAPYAADEVVEITQVLGDGTHIHNETKTTVYRDSEGRVRRETPNEISIWDPTAGTNYVLNPKSMTARKMTLNLVFRSNLVDGSAAATVGPNQTATYFYHTDGEAGGAGGATITVGGRGQSAAEVKAMNAGTFTKAIRRDAGNRESLGTQMLEGVNADGERYTSTIEAGAIGNDRPIQSTTERWYSQELQTNIMTRRSDPRTGDEVFKLTNIRRGEQSPMLFLVPPGYTMVDGK
jgi:hypothetical protein